MKSRFLFPHKWRTPGIVLSSIGFVVFLLNIYNITDKTGAWFKTFNIDVNILANDIECVFLVIGLLLVGFSKEKLEDEQIAQQRADSLQWAIYFNYGILLLCVFLFNGVGFLDVMAYNIVTPFVFFIIRFRWKIYQLNRAVKLAGEAA